MKKYQILFEKAVESIMVIQNQEIKIENPKSQELTGYNDKDLLSMSFLDLFCPEDSLSVIIFHRKRLMGEKENTKLQVRIVKKNKDIRWVELDGIKILWNDQPAILNLMIDITDRKKAEDALKQSEEKYRLLTEYASDVIWALNIDERRFTYISPGIIQQRGFTVEEAMNQSLEESLTPKSLIKFNEAIRKNLDEFRADTKNPKNYIIEIQQFCKDGSIIWIEVSMKYRVNSNGETEIVGASRNIEKRKQAQEQVLTLSYCDQLTGLYNKSFFEEELKRLDTKRNLPISLILAHINGLKIINDAFGNIMGDNLLKTIADITKNVSRSDDIVTRIAGDEFAVLLPKTTSNEAEIIVNRLKEAIDNTEMEEIILSVSFGWATKNEQEEDFKKIFIEAEDFMNRRKLLESNTMKSETVRQIIKRLNKREKTKIKHNERVSDLCQKIGRAMNLSQTEINDLGLMGLLHDIGKIGISEKILNKSKKLEPENWQEIKRHPEIGYQILRSVNEFSTIAQFVLCHHERIDGKGYPRGLKNDQIPKQAKILTVAEAYDVMINEYPYKKPLTRAQAIKELKENSNTQFDGKIVDTFIEKVLDEEKK